MPIVYLEPIPRRTSVAQIVRLIGQAAGVDASRLGKIDLAGAQAAIEVPRGWEHRLVRALDGARLGNGRVRASVRADQGTTGDEHFGRLARLLRVEAEAAAAQAAQRAARQSPAEAEKSGTSLVDLVVRDVESGLGGRYVLTFAKAAQRATIPWTRLDAGSPVVVSAVVDSRQAVPVCRGVVAQRDERQVQLATDRLPAEVDDHARWRIDLADDDAAIERQEAALARAESARGDDLAALREVLLGRSPPRRRAPGEMVPLDPGLNCSQQRAVALALAAEDVALIHGPPGTGKTTTVVELIRQAVARGDKVLACAPSNLAVDNLLEKLVDADERVVRLGHPARALPHLRAHSLDVLVDEHRQLRLARNLVHRALALFDRAGHMTRAAPARGARRDMRQEAKELLADARRIEIQVLESILDHASVLCSTLTALDSSVIGPRRFDLAVIDEACQSTEPASWIPLARSGRVVLAGDHRQLPPIIVSPEAAQGGFGVSLFERLAAMLGPESTHRLDVQYRMHEAIMGFSSREFYDAALAAAPGVAGHRLCDLPGVVETALTISPMAFIDTAGAGLDEELEPDGESRLNRGEADVVVRQVRALIDAGVAPVDIGVIAPYAAQVRLLRDLVDLPGFEIDSVDGFQGREKEAVVISLVRSNPQGEIGFLAETRRTNVALTRARRKLIVVGDSATLAAHDFYRRLFDYFEAQSAYRSVWEEA